MPIVWMTAQEAADYARVHVSVIYREVKAGRLRAVRIGGRRDLRFRDVYLDDWLEASITPVDVAAHARFGSR